VPNTQSRWTETIRQYHGEDEAIPLVAWLNSPGDPDATNYQANEDSRARIARILDWLAEMGAAGAAEGERCNTLAAHINEMLAECALLPQVEIVSGKELACALEFHPAPSTRHHAELTAHREIGKPFLYFGGHHALMWLINIWRSGNIAKLRRCKGCGKFLYKRFSNQESCSDRCREAAYKRSQEYKDKRNKRLREQYQLQKRGIVR